MGSFLSYLLSAFAVVIHSLVFLILGRVIATFTAGSQPIVQAAIVDVSSEEHKARNIGLILLINLIRLYHWPDYWRRSVR
ncbi:hypothetical protein [Candidatus Coxiella mudrowiae]|uniref:hypothetical protein n=1 Tax=Candidatus Coxiella mudrowiae TaxID=2054173 RepID=UPI00066297CC|nr:hypothetical protein [Candidatus Coxiella mudrowiae]